MQIKKQLILRKIADENVLVPTGSSVADTNGLFMLTDTAAFIWECLQEAESSDDIAEKITQEYDVDFSTAKADAEKFLDFLRSYDII